MYWRPRHREYPLRRLALLVTVFMLSASTALAASCTDGVDCYCDKAAVTGDGSLLMCEDFEAPTLTADTNFGGSSYPWGPWYDATGSPPLPDHYTGLNSYFTKTYGSAVESCSYTAGDSDPVSGEQCTYDSPPFFGCFLMEWTLGDPWGGNSRACLDIISAGEFDDDVTLSDPVNPGGTNGVFDGASVIGHRVPIQRTSGIIGEKNWTDVSEVGITMAVAFSANIVASNVTDASWKTNEWASSAQAGNPEFWSLGTQGKIQLDTDFLIGGFIWWNSQALCQTALNSATVSVGEAACNDNDGLGTLVISANTDEYVQATDWPHGTWACHRAYQTGMATSTTIRIWHNEVLVFEITGMDSSQRLHQGYGRFVWNAFANHNDTGQHGPPYAIEQVYRYEDNVHIREGVPVSCAQIGWGAGATAVPGGTGLTITDGITLQ